MFDFIGYIFIEIIGGLFQTVFRRKNYLEILIGGISGIFAVLLFPVLPLMYLGDLSMSQELISLVVGGAIGGVIGSVIGTGIQEGKLNAIISGAIGGAIVCGILILLLQQ